MQQKLKLCKLAGGWCKNKYFLLQPEGMQYNLDELHLTIVLDSI